MKNANLIICSKTLLIEYVSFVIFLAKLVQGHLIKSVFLARAVYF
jgi:hypothetical protein